MSGSKTYNLAFCAVVLFQHLHVGVFRKTIFAYRWEVCGLPTRAVKIMLNLGRHGGWVYLNNLKITKEASETKVDYHIINVAVTVASGHVTFVGNVCFVCLCFSRTMFLCFLFVLIFDLIVCSESIDSRIDVTLFPTRVCYLELIRHLRPHRIDPV